MALEFAFHIQNRKFDYCLKGSKNDAISLLKLHGSINWSFCNNCNNISPLVFDRAFKLPHPEDARYEKKICMRYYEQIQKRKHKCNNPDCTSSDIDDMPLIVPPTWNKTMYHSNISAVWKKAAEELSCAENIIVIGYSLPESDMFFRYLFALGSISKTELKKFWVIDIDQTVEDRYERLVSGQIKRRGFKFIRDDFSGSLRILSQALRN